MLMLPKKRRLLVANTTSPILERLISATSNASNHARMAESQDVGKYFEVAKKLVIDAGEVFKISVASEKTVTTKSNAWDLLTEYDKKIEDILVSGLSAEFPSHKFIAEESTAEDGFLPELTDAPTWFIDPIDGTTNFIHAFPQSCISVGLTVCKRLELGIIYNPPKNEMYTAIRGQGAFLNGKPIKTSKVSTLRKALINIEPTMLAIPSNRDIVISRFEALAEASEGLRAVGSATCALAYIASGTLDAFQQDRLGPWDVAAGTLIVEEAGGTVLNTRGGPLDIMKPKMLAASNEILAMEISKLIVATDLQTQRKRLKRVPSSSKLL